MNRNKISIIMIIWSIYNVVIQIDAIDVFIIDIILSIVRRPNYKYIILNNIEYYIY